MNQKKSRAFENPDLLYVNSSAPDIIKKRIFARILPTGYVKPFFFSLLVLFLSPLLLLFIPSFRNEGVTLSVIVTISTSFVLFSVLSGLIFAQLKSPYIQELKEKFGYTEK
ncbi:MAG: hypothetical protein KDK36_04240 [Leptospiraceae bacterium]|nr:hypothetical protein [Leptospiraceae bacterium]